MRILLFLATNLAIIVLLTIVMSIAVAAFGVQPGGMYYWLIFAAIIGMGGSFISLALSKWMAKRATGAQVIETPSTETEKWLLDTVARQAQMAGIGMPEVAIYPAPDINAFATGMNKNAALVAVSSGLLNNMSRDEAEAVLAHEISHVANGDMVTLALIQGVVNTFVIFLARIIAQLINNALRSNGRDGLGFFTYYAVVIVLEIVLGIFASIIVMWFSRYREFRADAGGAQLAGKHKMIAALQRLQQSQPVEMDSRLTAFGINGKIKARELFMSHPPLEKRIEALQQN